MFNMLNCNWWVYWIWETEFLLSSTLVHRDKKMSCVCCVVPLLPLIDIELHMQLAGIRSDHQKYGLQFIFTHSLMNLLNFRLWDWELIWVAQHNILIKEQKKKEKQFLLITRIWISISSNSPILLLHPQPVIIISILMMCVNKVRNGKVSIMPNRFYDY